MKNLTIDMKNWPLRRKKYINNNKTGAKVGGIKKILYFCIEF